jgi:hypothetical protein
MICTGALVQLVTFGRDADNGGAAWRWSDNTK